MELKFICSEDFEAAAKICNRIREYLPNLVDGIEIYRSSAFKGIFETWEVLPMIDEIIKPDSERDMVLVVIDGSLYLADLELFEAVGCTLDYFRLNRDGTTKLYSKMPKLGAQLLPNHMSEEPRGDAEYWAGRSFITSASLMSTTKAAFFMPKRLEKARWKTAEGISAPSAGSFCAS